MAGKRTVLTVQLRRLAALLSEMRERAGISKEVVSERTGINVTTLYRIESAQARPQRRTLMAMLDLYGVDDAGRSDVIQLLQEAQKPGMSRPFEAAVSDVYAAYINFESDARSERMYELSCIPGLLQTERYAWAVLDTTMPKVDAGVVEQRLRARVERAKVLNREGNPLELWVVLDEAAIRRVVGGAEVMREQLLRLAEESEKRNVILQVLPFDAGAHPAMVGSFVLLDFFPEHGDPELVYVEGIAGDNIVEGETEIRRFGVMFDQLRAMALSPRDSIALIHEVADSLADSGLS
ncbi:helix-turn-helix domain-containing protein [Nocardia stercoris]|uniref:Helix-turn-helix domain-containing protein n=1 Tax=Nocardia stercoris TaxID=2483361 RepID=A0A3M2LF22_9NOCA|nr:helix-turn-helix transcriptional regulator [Nocardia stercoris]RMI35646.1 helix-turn-helix domain-containing protein [Nocardia stercoris]